MPPKPPKPLRWVNQEGLASAVVCVRLGAKSLQQSRTLHGIRPTLLVSSPVGLNRNPSQFFPRTEIDLGQALSKTNRTATKSSTVNRGEIAQTCVWQAQNHTLSKWLGARAVGGLRKKEGDLEGRDDAVQPSLVLSRAGGKCSL